MHLNEGKKELNSSAQSGSVAFDFASLGKEGKQHLARLQNLTHITGGRTVQVSGTNICSERKRVNNYI